MSISNQFQDAQRAPKAGELPQMADFEVSYKNTVARSLMHMYPHAVIEETVSQPSQEVAALGILAATEAEVELDIALDQAEATGLNQDAIRERIMRIHGN